MDRSVYKYLYLLFILIFFGCSDSSKKGNLPNILWIVSEDNSPFLGCYGDPLASSPKIDKLASEGFLYTHSYANAPVCAPARNTIITGVYACSNGNQHMRSTYPLSDEIKMFPFYLRKAGYYCTNNSKEDYNTIKHDSVWDESSRQAHYSNRQEEQPFFHIHNIGISHESSIHKTTPNTELIHRPENMLLPPYHPSTEEMKHDWAQYYDKVSLMDSVVGSILDKLNADGLSESTIVFYYSDHGGVLGRSKRYVYESGTHVPFIIRIPEKFKHLKPSIEAGDKIARLISFVDLAPTMLSITNIAIPDYMQGTAFLGEQKSKDPDYAYMFRGRMDEWYDMCRSVRDEKYRYIKNYMPFRIYGQRVAYLWRAQSMLSWENSYLIGECDETQSIFWNTKPTEELYDTENDPWEVNNIANDPEYKKALQRLRKANREWMMEINDAGLIPEADLIRRAGDMPMYDYMRSGEVPLAAILQAAEDASRATRKDVKILLNYIRNKDSAIRYWGATGLLILGEEAKSAKPELLDLLNDESPNVVNVAAETLYYLGEQDEAVSALLRILKIPEDKARCHALNVIKYIEDDRVEIKKVIAEIHPDRQYQYSSRIVDWFVNKWDLKVE